MNVPKISSTILWHKTSSDVPSEWPVEDAEAPIKSQQQAVVPDPVPHHHAGESKIEDDTARAATDVVAAISLSEPLPPLTSRSPSGSTSQFPDHAPDGTKKTKPKTRGQAAVNADQPQKLYPATAQVEVAQPEPPTVTSKQQSYEDFRLVFCSRGSLRWRRFGATMADAGFACDTAAGGSRRIFRDMRGRFGPIRMYQPHGVRGDEMDHIQLRNIKRDMELAGFTWESIGLRE